MRRTNYRGKTYIGADNGVSGSIGIIPAGGGQAAFYKTPVFSCLNYQKSAKNLNRVDVLALESIFLDWEDPFALIERPMINPGRFSASLSAIRALEATLIVLEHMDIPYQYIDSKEWQKAMLPSGIKGSDLLKKASLDVGKRLFPQFASLYKGDADGMLIAEWGRRMQL